MAKKLSTILMLIVMIFTPVLLTGCVPSGGEGNTGGNTGGNNGGNNGGVIPTDPVVQPKLSDYFDGVKITYNPDLSGELSTDKQLYLIDIKSQISTLSKELIIRLMAQYGLGVSVGGYRLEYSVGGQDEFEYIYENGFIPFDSNPPSFGNTYSHAHKDAVRKSFYANGTDAFTPWNWSLPNVGYSVTEYINTYVSQYSNNLQLAIYMIKLGKNIHIIGSDDYNEYVTYTQLGFIEKELKKDELATKMPYVGMLEEEMQKLEAFILREIIGNQLLAYDQDRFNDPNANGIFDAEQFHDANDNGLRDEVEVYNDLNEDGIWNSGVVSGAYDTMKLYFKNYRNTVASIINKIRVNTERYPKIAGIQYQDFTMSQVESGLDEIFVIPTGAQAFKSLIFMNSEEVNLESIWLAFESTRSFNLQITARYYKAGQGAIFDNVLTTLFVKSGAWDLFNNSNDYEINIKNILATYDILNSTLQPFVNNTESYSSSVVLNSQAPAADYFILEKASDGTTTLAKYYDTSTDFFEIIFSAIPLAGDTNTSPILFKFGFIDIYFS